MYIITTGLNPNEPDILCHHGIKGQKWGVRRYQDRNGRLTSEGKNRAKVIRKETADERHIASSIKKNVDKYKNGGPAGNQNCQLCTWCSELQFRGNNVLPRPIYSPRDPVLQMSGLDIIKNPVKKSISNRNDIFKEVESSPNGARYYMHVNWKDSAGGHEFMLLNKNGKAMLMDSQVGLVTDLSSKKAKTYIDDINYDNSFISRIDDKEINTNVLKYNTDKYLVKWDNKKDIQYMLDNGMIGESDMAEARKMLEG